MHDFVVSGFMHYGVQGEIHSPMDVQHNHQIHVCKVYTHVFIAANKVKTLLVGSVLQREGCGISFPT